jgi:hypothetical protein
MNRVKRYAKKIQKRDGKTCKQSYPTNFDHVPRASISVTTPTGFVTLYPVDTPPEIVARLQRNP